MFGNITQNLTLILKRPSAYRVLKRLELRKQHVLPIYGRIYDTMVSLDINKVIFEQHHIIKGILLLFSTEWLKNI